MMRLECLVRLTLYGHRALCTWLNWPAFVSITIFRPPLYVIFFALLAKFALGSAAMQFAISGVLAYGAVSILAGGAIQSLGNEAVFGTLPTLLLTKADVTAFLTKGLALLPGAGLCYATGVVAALVIGWTVPARSAPAIAVCFAAMALGLAAFALCFASFSILTANWILPTAVVEGVVFSLTGMIIPVAAIPMPLRIVSELLPVTHGLAALRESVAAAGWSAAVGRDLGFEVGLAVVYAAAGVILLRAVKRYCRLTGAAV